MNGYQLRRINLSVVLYNTSVVNIQNLLSSLKVIKSPFKLYIIDNSPTDKLKYHFISDNEIIYIHNPRNPGFGASHNLALQISINENVPFHFIINPDVYFRDDVITEMVSYMERHDDVGMMMPQILNIDGSIQYLPKLLPSPSSIFIRKIKLLHSLFPSFINKYELRNISSDLIYEAPILSGCFILFNVEALKHIGVFDDRFFMYFEDWDLSRRMHKKFKTIYFPKISVYHEYEAGANKNIKLFMIFLKSAWLYFNKWGWFFDWERSKINKDTLLQFK